MVTFLHWTPIFEKYWIRKASSQELTLKTHVMIRFGHVLCNIDTILDSGVNTMRRIEGRSK